MEQTTQRILYHIVKAINNEDIVQHEALLRTAHMSANELRGHILSLISQNIIYAERINKKTVYKLTEHGKANYLNSLSADQVLKLRLERLVRK